MNELIKQTNSTIMVGKYVIESLARVEVTVDIASEFRYRNPLIEK